MLERSADFLWAKQQAHLDNISNAETPGYKVKTVTFEERFGEMLKLADSKHASPRRIREAIQSSTWTVHEDDEVTRMDDNGVNVLEQSVEAVRTAMQLQYTYQSIFKDMSILGTAIGK